MLTLASTRFGNRSGVNSFSVMVTLVTYPFQIRFPQQNWTSGVSGCDG